MLIKNRKPRFIVVALLSLLPGSVWAELGDLPVRTSGFYVGAGLGYTDVEANYGPAFISGSDLGYKLFGGYRLPRAFLPWGVNIALDAAYVNFGDITDQALGADLELDIDGFNFSAVGILPITGRWEIFGRIGAFVSDTEVTVNGTVQETSSDTDLSLGLGLAFQTGSAFAVLLELESFNVVEGAWLASIGGTYQFK